MAVIGTSKLAPHYLIVICISGQQLFGRLHDRSLSNRGKSTTASQSHSSHLIFFVRIFVLALQIIRLEARVLRNAAHYAGPQIVIRVEREGVIRPARPG